MHAASRFVLLAVAFFVAAVFQTETVSLVSNDVAYAARSGFAETNWPQFAVEFNTVIPGLQYIEE